MISHVLQIFLPIDRSSVDLSYRIFGNTIISNFYTTQAGLTFLGCRFSILPAVCRWSFNFLLICLIYIFYSICNLFWYLVWQWDHLYFLPNWLTSCASIICWIMRFFPIVHHPYRLLNFCIHWALCSVTLGYGLYWHQKHTIWGTTAF